MGFRIVKISAGMTMEYEIISTNAPDKLIEVQLTENSNKQENGIAITNPYNIIQANGYIVKVMGCQDDFDDNEIEIDAEFDYCEY